MSAASSALGRGFNAFLRSNGEPLTLLRAGGAKVAVTAIVDRSPRPRKEQSPDFDPYRTSMIELRLDAVSTLPKKGDVFLDAVGVKHLVGPVKPKQFTVECECRKGWEA